MTYQTNNETVADVTEGIFTGSSIVLSEALLEVDHGSETRDLTFVSVSVAFFVPMLWHIPVEYPKMKPPIDTHRPRMKDRHVRYLTGLSSRVRLSFSAVVESAREGVAAWEENCESAFPGLILSIKVETPMMIHLDNGEREGKKKRLEKKK
jgi:hypothetical protein